MSKVTKYIVYRIFTKKERPNNAERAVIYGWSDNKYVIQAFMGQRNNSKYKWFKVKIPDVSDDNYEFTGMYTCEFKDEKKILIPTDYIDDPEYMIDYVNLKSAKSGETIKLFTTLKEEKEAEKNIQIYYHSLCSLSEIPGNGDYLGMYRSLDPRYRRALEYIGYIPKEFDIMYDSCDPVDEYNTLNKTIDEINEAYDGAAVHPPETASRMLSPMGLMMISTDADKVLYSLENFIMAMRDNL